jgi:hypothetical protein
LIFYPIILHYSLFNFKPHYIHKLDCQPIKPHVIETIESARKDPVSKRSADSQSPSTTTPVALNSPITPARATLDYVSPPLVPQMARRLKVSPERIPTSSLRIQVPPMPLESIEDLFGPDDTDCTPKIPLRSSMSPTPTYTSSVSQPMSSPVGSSVSGVHPSFSPGSYTSSPSPSVASSREQELEQELHRMRHFNHQLQDDVVRLSNMMATTTIEIHICGSPTKRDLPCKNRRGTRPFHSPSGAPKAGCQHFRPAAPSSPASTDHSVEQWQI